MVKKLPIPARKCGVCGAEYRPKRPSQIICTMKCFRAFRMKQKGAGPSTTSQSQAVATGDVRQCASCGDPFSGDPLFVTCPRCRRPCKVTTGGCQRWGGTDKVADSPPRLAR